MDRNTPATEVIWPQDLPDLIDMAREWPLPTDDAGGMFSGDVLIHKLGNALKRLAPEVDALHKGKRQREAEVRALEARLRAVEAAFVKHMSQCPQCHDAILRPSATRTQPEKE